MDTKIAIAVITNRGVKPQTVLSLLSLTTKHPTHPIVATEGYHIGENRTYCVVQAINNECSHILFVDDDMTFPPHTIDHLLSLNKQVVGVNSNSRKLPLTTTVAFIDDKGELAERPEEFPTEPFKCYQVGLGVALIDLNVFKIIEQPWFRFEEVGTGKLINGEDGWFCDRARDKGIDIWCDPTLPIGHIGDYTY